MDRIENKFLISKENKLLDIFKFFSSLLIVASHCLPLVPNDNVNFYYGQWFFRFCVPLFLISSGFFFASFSAQGRIRYIKRIAVIYFFSSLLYIPFYITKDIYTVVRTAIFGYHHLWYLSALLLALILYFLLEKTPAKSFFDKIYPFIAISLIVIGAFYDEYQYVFNEVRDIPIVTYVRNIIQVTGGHKHALFFAFPMILIGKFLYDHLDNIKLSKTACVLFTIVSLIISFVECLGLRHFAGENITCDITLFNFYPAVFLLVLTFVYQPKLLETINTKTARKTADIVYISHVFFMRVISKVLHLTYIPRLALTLVLSLIVSYLYIKTLETGKIRFAMTTKHK